MTYEELTGEVKFRTNYCKEPDAPIRMSEELITEQTGYRTTKEIVEGMVLAGQRLSDYRHGILDNFDEEYDETQDTAVVYEKDPVDLQNLLEARHVRYRGEKKEVSDNLTENVEEKEEPKEVKPEGETEEKKK